MPPTQLGFFAYLIATFQDALRGASDALYPWVLGTLGFLLLLELGRICWGIGLEGQKVAALAGYLLKFLVLCYVIPRWEYFFTSATTLGVHLGLLAGGHRLTQQTFLNPGAYMQIGFHLGATLWEQLSQSHLTNVSQIVLSPFMTIAYFIAWTFFLVAFFLMALIIFLAQIEAAFAVPGLLVLLPFLAFGKTGWIGQGVVTYLVKLAYKFFMLALIASIVYPVIDTITIQNTPDIRQALLLDFVALTLAACFLYGPAMARNMMSGVFTLGAGSLANAALLSLHTATLASTTMLTAGRATYNFGGAVLREASGGRVDLPTWTPAPSRPQLTASLRDGARHLHD